MQVVECQEKVAHNVDGIFLAVEAFGLDALEELAALQVLEH